MKVTAGWCHHHRHGCNLPRRHPWTGCAGCFGDWYVRDEMKREQFIGYRDNRTEKCLKCGKPATSWGGHVHRTVR